MRISAALFALCTLLAALLTGAPARGAEPEVLASRTFDVTVDRTAGNELVIEFALALSEVDSYPVTITAISGETEEQLYNGSLAGGVYRLRTPLKKIRSGAVRVILKTRVINRGTGGNDVYVVYQKWEGQL